MRPPTPSPSGGGRRGRSDTLLEGLEINNYGAYAGRNAFDLSVRPGRPLVLVGGLNGAGKTTILESMMIALYGRAYLGRRTPAKAYESFVLSHIHKSRGGGGGKQAVSASVALSFRFYHAGSDDLYRVVRSWEAGGGGVSETLRVERNGAAAADIDESQWQAFVEGLIPLGIARLFFFDGEKIVSVAESAAGGGGRGGAMRESLDVLLGAELIDALSADLDLYVARRAGGAGAGGGSSGGGGGRNPALVQYKAMLSERDALLADIDALEGEAASKDAQLSGTEARVAGEEAKIKGAGGGYADLRAGLLAEKAVIDERMQGHARAIRDALSGAAPLAMAAPLLKRTAARIAEDVEAARSAAAAAAAAPKIAALRSEMAAADFWPGGRADAAAADRIAGRLAELFRHSRDDPALFDMPDAEAAATRATISAALSAPSSLCAELGGYARAGRRMEEIAEGLARAPSDDEMAARVRGISGLHREIGMLRAEREHVGQRLSAKRSNLKVVRNRLRRMFDEMRRDERADKGVEIAGRMKAALATYRERLLARKMRELEDNLLAAVSSLLHKGSIERIAIRPDTLEVGAYEHGIGDPVPLGSMGERQMIGTALLWAIAKTSGRPLPFVIDTPLGRLDGAHLSNLVGRFYPAASHQTVLLSTDREIGEAEYARLRPHVARAYRIEYDRERRRTIVHDGYFGDGGGNGGGGGGGPEAGGDADVPA